MGGCAAPLMFPGTKSPTLASSLIQVPWMSKESIWGILPQLSACASHEGRSQRFHSSSSSSGHMVGWFLRFPWSSVWQVTCFGQCNGSSNNRDGFWRKPRESVRDSHIPCPRLYGNKRGQAASASLGAPGGVEHIPHYICSTSNKLGFEKSLGLGSLLLLSNPSNPDRYHGLFMTSQQPPASNSASLLAFRFPCCWVQLSPQSGLKLPTHKAVSWFTDEDRPLLLGSPQRPGKPWPLVLPNPSALSMKTGTVFPTVSI